jgi:hypothetical protein
MYNIINQQHSKDPSCSFSFLETVNCQLKKLKKKVIPRN